MNKNGGAVLFDGKYYVLDSEKAVDGDRVICDSVGEKKFDSIDFKLKHPNADGCYRKIKTVITLM